MKTRYIFLPFTVLTFTCSVAWGQGGSASRATRHSPLPDDPCEVLSAAQVSAATGLDVTSVKRVPSIKQIVRAQDEGREPEPGIICRYETRSDFGEVMIAVPARTERGAAKYWEARAKYFETFPGSAQPVAGLGEDAWLSGGAGLHVLVRGGEHFTVSTQLYQPRSRDLLVSLARVVVARR